VRAGAAVIAFDIIFDEARSAFHDQSFADTIRKAHNIVLFESLERETVRLMDKEGSPVGSMTREKLVSPIPPLAQAAVALAPFPLHRGRGNHAYR